MSYYEHIKRSVAKSITFRILVMLADGLIIYTITKKVNLALGIIVFSNVSSTVIYYIHERVWNKTNWGKNK